MPTFDTPRGGGYFSTWVDDFLDVPGFNPSGAMSVYIVFSNLRSEQDLLLEMNSTDPLISTMLSGTRQPQYPGFSLRTSLSVMGEFNVPKATPLVGSRRLFPWMITTSRTNGLEFSGVLDYGKTLLVFI